MYTWGRNVPRGYILQTMFWPQHKHFTDGRSSLRDLPGETWVGNSSHDSG